MIKLGENVSGTGSAESYFTRHNAVPIFSAEIPANLFIRQPYGVIATPLRRPLRGVGPLHSALRVSRGKIEGVGQHQRIYSILVIENAQHPPASSKHVAHPTSPPVLSDSQVVGVVYSMYVNYQSRKRLGETHVWKTLGGVVRSITNIYSLRQTNNTAHCTVHKTRGQETR